MEVHKYFCALAISYWHSFGRGVSLYFARHDKRIRLEVNAGHRLIVTQGQKGPHPEYLMIRIVNIGHREAQITNIGWMEGWYF
jgi:hypothetical protein